MGRLSLGASKKRLKKDCSFKASSYLAIYACSVMTTRPKKYRQLKRGALGIERAEGGAVRVKGAIPLYAEQELYEGVYERFAKGSLDDAMMDKVELTFNHAGVLSTTNNDNLVIRKTEEGISFEASLADTTLSRDVLSLIESGDIGGCSFAIVAYEDEPSERQGGGMLYTITKAGIFRDISLVTFAAYQGTDYALRSSKFLERKNADMRAKEEVSRYLYDFKKNRANHLIYV